MARRPTLQQVLSSFRDCAPLFRALGDAQRQRIIMLLTAHERLNVGAIAERTPLSRPTISHHLRVLRQAGLVRVEREARENYYSLSLEGALVRLRRLVERAELSCD